MTDSFEVTSLNDLGCPNRMQFPCLVHKKLSSDVEITDI